MDNVVCTGSEDSIFDCSHTTEEDCEGNEGAGAECLNLDTPCSSILFDEKLICSTEFDNVNSQVICKWGGYTTGLPAYYRPKDPSKRKMSNSTSQYYFNLRCNGVETSPDDCVQETSHICASGLFAGISCSL